MTNNLKNNLFLSVVITLLFLWFSIDATQSIGRGLVIGLFTALCFFGLKNAVIDDNSHFGESERYKAMVIYYLVFGVIFYFVIQYTYTMTNLNNECFENDNEEACNSLENYNY